MSSYKLTYFDFNGGRGEPIRIALHAAGIEFQDERLSFEQFGKMRQGTPFNALPVLNIDGADISQTNSLLRYVGKLADLYPTDNLQALYCDEVMSAFEDVNHHVGRTLFLKEDALRLAREKLVDGWLSVFIKGLGKLLARGGGKYFADNQLTVADLKAFVQVRSLRAGILDHVPTDLVDRLAPALAEHQGRIEADPRVVAYYASRAT
jgi:glutathione S-transferase